MDNLRRLGNQISIQLQSDAEGYVGRECPVKDCLGYFKITFGTGVKGPAPCHCPYCGHSGNSRTFFTKEQIRYAQSVAFQKVVGAVHEDLKSMEFSYEPSGPFGIGISMKVQDSPLPSISHYREKQLETEVVCDQCTLRYAIYGVFGWCPDCGVHNSMQILVKNLEIAKKKLALAETLEKDLADHLVGDALESVVASFDGFGREVCSQKGQEIRFQNLTGARRQVQNAFNFDFADELQADEWDKTFQAFQKRHLLAHKMGVIDDEYIQKTRDLSAVQGRKIRVKPGEVKALTLTVERLGRRLYAGVSQP